MRFRIKIIQDGMKTKRNLQKDKNRIDNAAFVEISAIY